MNTAFNVGRKVGNFVMVIGLVVVFLIILFGGMILGAVVGQFIGGEFASLGGLMLGIFGGFVGATLFLLFLCDRD